MSKTKVVETKNSFIFPEWGIEVSKTEVSHKRKIEIVQEPILHPVTREPLLDEKGEPQVTTVEHTTWEPVEHPRDLAAAKAHILEHHGKDVDKDTPPPDPAKIETE